eukprot:13141383-Alexandrium_andersonii.AAC.1
MGRQGLRRRGRADRGLGLQQVHPGGGHSGNATSAAERVPEADGAGGGAEETTGATGLSATAST